MFAVGFIKYRLIADVSPRKFGVVEQEKLYRSGIVWPHQVGGLHHDYGIRHIVTLIDGDWLQQFDDDERITFVV